MIKAVIFDMDGVLIDSELYYMERILYVLEHYFHISVTLEDLAELPGGNNQHFEKVIGNILNLHGFTFAEYRQKQYENNIVNPTDYTSLLNDHVHTVLSWLKNNHFKICLASSSSLDNIKKVIAQNELQSFFDIILSGQMFKESKPNPEIYLQCIKQLQLNPEEIIVIEDSTYGIEAASKANLSVIAKRDTHFKYDQSLANKQIDDLIEIIDILETNIPAFTLG